MPLDGAQGTFGFFDEPPGEPPHAERLFFGVFPASETAAHIYGFANDVERVNRLRGSQISRDRLHLSLHHVGDYRRLTSGIIFGPVQAGNDVVFPPFQISLHFIQSFESSWKQSRKSIRRPTVLLGKGEGLYDLHEFIGDAMRNIGLEANGLFNPHVTLFYNREPVPSQEIEPIRMTVDRFFLIHSRVGLTEYRILGCWPLTG